MEELCASIEDKEMQIVIERDRESLITVCRLQSKIIQVPAIESEDELFDSLGNEKNIEDLPFQNLLLLLPCTCDHEFEKGEINLKPELN